MNISELFYFKRNALMMLLCCLMSINNFNCCVLLAGMSFHILSMHILPGFEIWKITMRRTRLWKLWLDGQHSSQCMFLPVCFNRYITVYIWGEKKKIRSNMLKIWNQRKKSAEKIEMNEEFILLAKSSEK